MIDQIIWSFENFSINWMIKSMWMTSPLLCRHDAHDMFATFASLDVELMTVTYRPNVPFFSQQRNFPSWMAKEQCDVFCC